MGYETRLYIGEVHNSFIKGSQKNTEDCDYFGIIAMIDLCKTGIFTPNNGEPEKNTRKVYIYGTDGDTQITKDCYGDQLFAIEPKDVLQKMIEANKQEKYRRYEAAIPLLKALIKSFPKGTLKCILYGY
jgi:hypothetical protein